MKLLVSFPFPGKPRLHLAEVALRKSKKKKKKGPDLQSHDSINDQNTQRERNCYSVIQIFYKK